MKKNRSRNKRGALVLNDVVLEKHEMATVAFLLALGLDIELISPSGVPGRQTPDLWMRGLQWEMKSPRYSQYSTIEHAFRAAVRQSENIIFDLRRVPGDDKGAIRALEQRFAKSKRTKRMLIISKQGGLLQYGWRYDKM